MKPVDLQLQGRVYFDFFLFAPHADTGCELGLIGTIIEAGKQRFLLHPIFSLFMQLKWAQIKNIFYSLLVIILLFEVGNNFWYKTDMFSGCFLYLHPTEVLMPQGHYS